MLLHWVSSLVPRPRPAFCCSWAQCVHEHLNHFYHPFYPNIAHVRKDTRPSPAFLYYK